MIRTFFAVIISLIVAGCGSGLQPSDLDFSSMPMPKNETERQHRLSLINTDIAIYEDYLGSLDEPSPPGELHVIFAPLVDELTEIDRKNFNYKLYELRRERDRLSR